MEDEHKKQTNYNTCPYKTKFFSNHTKDEIGMTFRQIDFAIAKSLSACLSRTDGKQGLRQMETR